MSFPEAFSKFIRLSALALGAAGLLAQPAVAGDYSAPAPVTALPLYATLKTEMFPGTAAIQRVYVTTGTNQFAFGLPDGFRLNAYPQKILFTRAAGDCFLTFRILTPLPSDSTDTAPDFFRRLAGSQFPGAKISGESGDRFANHNGPAFDLQWRNSGGTMQTAHIAFISAAAGVVEISLVTTSDKFATDQYLFNALLASLVTNEDGKLPAAAPPGNS